MKMTDQQTILITLILGATLFSQQALCAFESRKVGGSATPVKMNASMSSKTLEILKPGEVVTLTNDRSGGFVKVRSRKSLGWIQELTLARMDSGTRTGIQKRNIASEPLDFFSKVALLSEGLSARQGYAFLLELSGKAYVTAKVEDRIGPLALGLGLSENIDPNNSNGLALSIPVSLSIYLFQVDSLSFFVSPTYNVWSVNTPASTTAATPLTVPSFYLGLGAELLYGRLFIQITANTQLAVPRHSVGLTLGFSL